MTTLTPISYRITVRNKYFRMKFQFHLEAQQENPVKE